MAGKYKDITGLELNNKRVLGFDKRKGKHIYWKTKCLLCGNVYSCLAQGIYRCKKCKKCAYKGERPYRRLRPHEYRYNTFVNRAKYPVLLTYEDYVEFTKIRECHYCGETIPWPKHRKKGQKNQSGCNLDRKDNDIGYTKENVVVCCGRCNYAKGSHFNYDEWVEIGKTIRTFKVRDYKITPQSRIEYGNNKRENNGDSR